MTIVIYTDGACSGNPGPGGWGAFIQQGKDFRELSGFEEATTNNRMELMAVIQALESLEPQTEVTLVTDSRYVHDGITVWIHQWCRNNWMTAARNPVKNKDLWQRLEMGVKNHKITWQWVKGHSQDPGNERADTLARTAIIRRQMTLPRDLG